MAEHICASFVLTRGPAGLQRRLPIQVPIDGRPVTIGRATDNDVVLEVDLIFSSQWHCRVFASRSEPATGIEENGRENSGSPIGCKRQREEAERERGDLWIVDAGSSNGTFVNGVRIAASVPTRLQHRDSIVLGGMRDVEVGHSLPMEDLPPEIVTWCLSVDGNCEEDFGFVATPPVFLSMEFIVAQARLRALAALQDSPEAKITAPSSLYSSLKKTRYEHLNEGTKFNTESDRSAQQTTCCTASPVGGKPSDEEATRRSGTVVAYVDRNELNSDEVAGGLTDEVPSSGLASSSADCGGESSDALTKPVEACDAEPLLTTVLVGQTVQ